MTAPFTPTLSVIDAAEALARKAEAWPSKVATIDRETDAMRDRMARQSAAYFQRKDRAHAHHS